MATTTLAAIGSAPSSAQNAAQPGQRATRSAQEGSGQNAQTARIVTGTLTCRGSGTVGLVLGSKQTLSCVFERTSGGAGANYTAKITGCRPGHWCHRAERHGLDGAASCDNLPNSALASHYKGISANASVGVGVGANALIGGNRNSIVLQPLSVSATGVNIAAGVTGLRLTQN